MSTSHILPFCALWQQANSVELCKRATRHKVNIVCVNTYDDFARSDKCVSIFGVDHQALNVSRDSILHLILVHQAYVNDNDNDIHPGVRCWRSFEIKNTICLHDIGHILNRSDGMTRGLNFHSLLLQIIYCDFVQFGRKICLVNKKILR